MRTSEKEPRVPPGPPASGRAALRCALVAFAVLAAQPATIIAAPGDFIPFSEVRVGMKGTGRTVFSGDTIEEFDVEVIATVENFLPKKNLILVNEFVRMSPELVSKSEAPRK